MIDLSEIANCDEFAHSYIIHRKRGKWVAGRFVQDEIDIKTSGTVTSASPKELMQLPEGDRVAGVMIFYNTQPIYTSHGWTAKDVPTEGTADEIEWLGDRYRVTTIYDYSAQGFYKAFAVYMEGN